MKPASRWVHIVCMLLLLLGQHAALAHIAAHHTEHHPAPASDVQHIGADDTSHLSAECNFHGLYAQVLGGPCAAGCKRSIPRGSDCGALEAQSARTASDLPALRSRGPPRFS